MFCSIRWRIIVPYVFVVVITMLGLGIYLSGFVRDIHTNNLETTLISHARLIGDSIAPNLQEVSPLDDEIDSLAKHWANVLNVRVTIIDKEGVVLGESHEDRSTMENHLYRPEIQQALSEGQGVSMRYSQTVGYDMLYTGVPILGDGEVIGFARLALPMDQVETDLAQLRMNIFVATTLLAVIIIILGIVIAERTTSPVRVLSAAVDQIASGNLTTRLIPRSKDEVGQLTVAIDSMAQQLRNQFEVLQTERSRLAAILEQMTDGVVIVNKEGDIELINPAVEQLFDVDAESIGESLILALRHHSPVDLWQRCQDTGEKMHYRHQCVDFFCYRQKSGPAG